jgi:hypothetical protein
MFTLQHVRWLDDSHAASYNQLLGVYSTLEKAEAALERALQHSRFTGSTENDFQILGWQLDEDAWPNW